MNNKELWVAGALLLAGCQGSDPATVAARVGETLMRPQPSCDGYPRTGVSNGQPRITVCEEREFTGLPNLGAARMRTESGQVVAAGGMDTADVNLWAYVYASGPTPEAAEARAAEVVIHTAGNDFHATGPERENGDEWHVSFVAELPVQTGLTAQIISGSVYLENLNGSHNAASISGSVDAVALSGSLQATTVSGSIGVDLAGGTWAGSGVNAEAINGSIGFHAADGYSAHFVLETGNGTTSSDFHDCPSPSPRGSYCEFTTGSGGPTLRGATRNGSVSVTRKIAGLP